MKRKYISCILFPFLLRLLIAIWVVATSCQYFEKKENLLSEVITNDQFRVVFSNTGEIKSVHIYTEALPSTAFMRAHSGWLIKDKKTGIASYFRGKLLPIAQNVLEQKGTIDELGLEVESHYEGGTDYIKITGTVKSLLQKDRALDISFQFPVYDKGVVWEGDCNARDKIKPLQYYQGSFIKFPSADFALHLNKYQGPLTLYPYAGISDSGKKYGISAAIPPDIVSNHSFWYNNQIFGTTFHIGLSPDFRKPNEVTLSYIYFLHDPNWGFRDVTLKYQSFFPYYFNPDTLHTGLMRVAGKVPISDDKDFMIHVPTGDIYKAHSFEEFLQLSDVDSLKSEKVFPYVSIGQRQIFNLLKKPGSEDEALQVFEKWSTQDTFFYQSPESDNSFKTAMQLKGIIKNSNIYSPDQEPLYVAGQFQKSPALIFPLNPSFSVFKDTNLITIAKYIFSIYMPEVILPFRQAGGVYVGSLSEWGRLYNFRHEHFKYARYPLAYHPDSLYVSILNSSSHRELLDSLRFYQNKNHKILCCGGVLPGDLPFVHIGDYIETSISTDSLKNLNLLRWFRIASGPKPVFVRWNTSIQNSQEAHEQWNQCLAFGYFPSFTSGFTINSYLDSAIISMRQEYTPLLNSLNRAQWKPITYGWVSNDSLTIERFGTDRYSGIYFTIFNPYARSLNSIVSISLKPLKLPASTLLVNALAPEQRYSLFLDREGKINTSITLKPYEVIVFHAEY